MRVIMFDRQSLFIHGAIHSLQRLIPEINITGTCQAEDLWTQISASPSAIVMIDGNLIQDEGSTLLEAILHRFPAIRVILILAKKRPNVLSSYGSETSWPLFPETPIPNGLPPYWIRYPEGWSVFPESGSESRRRLRHYYP